MYTEYGPGLGAAARSRPMSGLPIYRRVMRAPAPAAHLLPHPAGPPSAHLPARPSRAPLQINPWQSAKSSPATVYPGLWRRGEFRQPWWIGGRPYAWWSGQYLGGDVDWMGHPMLRASGGDIQMLGSGQHWADLPVRRASGAGWL